MPFKLLFTDEATADLNRLENEPALLKRLKAVRKALGYLQNDPRHPSLHTHEYTTLTRQLGIKVFEAYVESKTPSAYRIFWCYGPNEGDITILAIKPHP